MRLGLGLLVASSCVVAMACAERESASEPTAAESTAAAPARGLAAYEAIYELRLDDEPLIFAGAERWIDRGQALQLASLLESAREEDPSALPERARVVLQNDVWGLWSRVSAIESSSAARERITRAAAALIARLAIARRAPGPSIAHAILPSSDGWRDLEPELPVMSHERLFGLRRIFHVRQTERPTLSRAIYSTLVAIDPDGRAYETDVVGDLEVLRFEGDRLVSARLFELDRRRLGERVPRASLPEIDSAARVPSAGADGFLATFDPPAPLSTLPCARCHDDAQAMSLPSQTLPLGRRNAALLRQLAPHLDALRAAQRAAGR